MPLNITILGLGAVGGSLGLALGTLDPQVLDVGRPVITGWDPDKRVLSEARGRLAADKVQADPVAAVREADVVFVTVPYGDMRELLALIAPALKQGAVVTDTLASKAQILQWAAELLPETVEFVGGHPLASFAGASIRGASRDALRDSIYCLVPSPHTPRTVLDGIEALVTAIGAKPYYMDTAEHDTYVAAAGHLPLAVAIALMETVSRSGGWREIQPIAGEALVRMTDLAGGEPETGSADLASNAVVLQGWLDRMIGTLVDMRASLDDPVALRNLLEHAQEMRESWLRTEPGSRPGEDAFHGSTREVERPNFSGLLFGRRPFRDRGKRR